MRIFVLPLLAFGFLSACSEGAGFGGGQSSGGEEESDGEEAPVDIPAEVSGSFLMDCRLLSEVDDNAPVQKVGCAAYDEKNQRYKGDYDFNLTLRDEGEVLSMSTQPSGNPEWDMYADIPTFYIRSKTAEFHMQVRTQTEVVVTRTFPVASLFTADLHSAAGYISPLTTFESHTAWKPGNKAWIIDQFNGALAEDFCGADGAIVTSGEEEGETDAILSAFEINPQPVAKEISYEDGTKECFQVFEFNGNKNDSYVYSIGPSDAVKCFAITVAPDRLNPEIRIIDVARSANPNELTQEALEAFIAVNNACGGG